MKLTIDQRQRTKGCSLLCSSSSWLISLPDAICFTATASAGPLDPGGKGGDPPPPPETRGGQGVKSSLTNTEVITSEFHSNYNTHSLNHFENPTILAMKSDIVTFIHVTSINVKSGFNLRIMKKSARWHCYTEKSKTKIKKLTLYFLI